MKKYLLTLALAIFCVFAFAVSISAEAYTVSSNEEYEATYEKAVNGDTIIINAKLNCDIQATKSITYVLKADWESARLVVNQSNVEVSFVADGDDYKIMPTNYSTTDGWMNIAEVYENVVINLGGVNGGTVTIDGTNVVHDRVSYATASNTADITWNLFDGSAIANFNPQVADSSEKAFIIYARTINMYSGSKIYANRIVGAPLLRATYFNLFGGEIFGNVLESKRTYSTGSGAIFVSERVMIQGGSIYKNIFNAKSSGQINMLGFFTTPSKKDTVILNVKIGDTYVSGNGSNEVSAMFGTNNSQFNTANFYFNSGMQKGTRYKFTDTPVLAYDEKTGKNIWQVSNYTKLSENWNGKSWTHTECPGSDVAVFIDTEKKIINNNCFDTYTLINAYINGVYSYSGSNTIAMPSGYELWSTSGTEYCHTGKAYTLDEVKSSLPIVLYSAYNAEKVTIDGTTMCSSCGKIYTCNNPEHDLQTILISYGKYTENGTKVLKCNTCGLEKAAEISVLPLFTNLGYSAAEYGDAMSINFKVNEDAIAEYESVMGIAVNYGVFAVMKEKIGDRDIFDADGKAEAGVIAADITDSGFTLFSLKIIGFTQEQKEIDLAMGAFVGTTKDTATEYSYLQIADASEGKYFFASYNDVLAILESKEKVA